ncbi:MAG: outer membrane protein assembly factor BamE [Pseudomonadota bacterium]
MKVIPSWMSSPASNNRRLQTTGRNRSFTAALLVALPLVLSGCFTQTLTHGYIVSPEALQQVPVGASQEQVLLALGTPSTIQTFGREGYYYISQTIQKRAAFARGRVVDQRVVAVYFDEEGLVQEIGDFGLKDGKVFDFLNRTTPTGGAEITFLQQILRSAAAPGSAVGRPGQP